MITLILFLRKVFCINSYKSKHLIFIFIFFITVYSCQSNNKPSSGSNINSVATVPAATEDYYQEIGKEIGLDFIHSIGDKELTNIVESSGAGAAFLDYDQDGNIDLYICSGTWIKGLSDGDKPDVMPENHLYHNLGDGTFEDVTKIAGVGGPWYSMGVTSGDFDNNGYPDLFVSNYGFNVLYKNNGNSTFTDVTKHAGVEGGENDFSVGAVWLDYDNDRFLDLYVGNYLNYDPNYKFYYASDEFPGPMAYDAQPDILYHNNGDGTFEDMTLAMGIKDVDGRAMGVGAADIDDDGFVDIYVANDHAMNYLWHNNGGKGFTDIGTPSGTAFGKAGESTISMAVDFADYNNDGLIDFFVSDDRFCRLFENKGNMIFTDQSFSEGIALPAGQYVGWSSSFIDYNNDGLVDIYKVNGALKNLTGMKDQLFENTVNGKFKDVSADRGSYFSEGFVGRGACFGDYDNDGDIDGFVVNLNDHGAFLRNNKGNQNNWLILNLVGTSSNRDGIGSRITVTSGGFIQKAQKKSTTGYLSQNDPRMHFGLAKNGIIEIIEIKWPSGKLQILENIKANQILTIKEP
jgi:enediyne biosynthesis protein E4